MTLLFGIMRLVCFAPAVITIGDRLCMCLLFRAKLRKVSSAGYLPRILSFWQFIFAEDNSFFFQAELWKGNEKKKHSKLSSNIARKNPKDI